MCWPPRGKSICCARRWRATTWVPRSSGAAPRWLSSERASRCRGVCSSARCGRFAIAHRQPAAVLASTPCSCCTARRACRPASTCSCGTSTMSTTCSTLRRVAWCIGRGPCPCHWIRRCRRSSTGWSRRAAGSSSPRCRSTCARPRRRARATRTSRATVRSRSPCSASSKVGGTRAATANCCGRRALWVTRFILLPHKLAKVLQASAASSTISC
mmetsp:Transcript_52707/g.151937  ORF Transcript_52707/g.151937 Transcript_52707/m.151937 type:complete len:214 (-) Transcript_52707:517-1158(-)